jgi:hypothetical protein
MSTTLFTTARKNFFGASAGLLGTYEAVAVSTRKVPTVSCLASRSPLRRLLLLVWVAGLAVHVARHQSP